MNGGNISTKVMQRARAKTEPLRVRNLRSAASLTLSSCSVSFCHVTGRDAAVDATVLLVGCVMASLSLFLSISPLGQTDRQMQGRVGVDVVVLRCSG